MFFLCVALCLLGGTLCKFLKFFLLHRGNPEKSQRDTEYILRYFAIGIERDKVTQWNRMAKSYRINRMHYLLLIEQGI